MILRGVKLAYIAVIDNYLTGVEFQNSEKDVC